MSKLSFLISLFVTAIALTAAEVWQNDLPAALAMYNVSGVVSAPVVEDNAASFTSKNGTVIFVRKNVNFSADNNQLSIQIKAPAGQRAIHCYFTTDSDPKYSESKKLSLYFRSTGEWQTVTFECSRNANWKGTITGFRMDFAIPAGAKAWCKEVRFSGKADLPTQWHFGTAGASAWDWRGALTAPATIVDGAMKLDFKAKYSPSPVIPVYMDCAKFSTLIIRIKASKPGNYGMVLYFKTEENNALSESQKITLRLNLTGEYQDIRIPLNRHSKWKGIVTGFRLDISAPEVPCSVEISDIVFADKENLAGLINFGKSFGPFYHLVPGQSYELTFSCNSPCKGELRIENAFGQIIQTIPVTVSAGNNRHTFKLPENGACLFFSSENQLNALLLQQIPAEKADDWTASWIADEENFRKKGHQYFQREVILDDEPVDCRFQGTADDRFDLYINGRRVTLQEMSWQNPRVADVTGFFKKGSNLIAFHLGNNGEASGLLANFQLVTASGTVIKIDTDGTFRTLRDPQEDWKTRLYSAEETFAPKVIGPYTVPPWGSWCLMAYEHFALRNQFTADNITLTPIKGGVHLECDLTARTLLSAQNRITVRAVAGNIVIAEEDIIFDRTLNNGDKIHISKDIFANKLLCDTYTLLFSGEDTHTLTADELTFTVSQNPDMRPNPTSEVRQTVNGPVIFIDGEAFNEMIFTSRILERMREHYDAGYRIFMVGVGTNVGKGLTTPGWNEDGYDFTNITRRINRITAAFPDIKMVLGFGIDAPYWWHRRYPDQSIYLDGKTTHENLASPASRQWREDGKAFIRAFIRHIESTPLRSNVIGYRLSSMCDGGEWQYPGVWANPQLHADFSVAMRDYFREFLRNKYGNDFDASNINVPRGAERRLPSDTYFRNPETEARVIDYIECQSDAVATAAIEFLQAAQEEAGDKIVGIYGGYLLFYSGFPVQTIGHLAFRKVYLSGAADYFSGPIDYHLRKLGLPGGNMAAISSLKLHGATYFQENDTRTFLNATPSHKHVDNLYESVSVLLRDSAIGLVTSTPIYTCDLTGNSYRNQGLIEAGAFLNRCFQGNFNPAQPVKPQVALLYSIDSLPYLVEKNHDVTNASSYLLRINTGRSGAQTDAYLLEDILMDNFPAGQYKCFVIVNGFYLTAEIRQAIENKLCKNGATVIFTPGAGIIHDRKLSMESMQSVTGFAFEPTGGKMPFRPAGMGDKPYVSKDYSDHRKVYLASTELTSDLYRELFAAAGVHIWIKSNDSVGTNGATCFIHADKAGNKTIYLPFRAKVTDMITGNEVPTVNNGTQFTVSLRQYETRLYKFERL